MKLEYLFNLEEWNLLFFFYDLEFFIVWLILGSLFFFSVSIALILYLIIVRLKTSSYVNQKILEATQLEQERLGMILHDDINPIIAISKLKLEGYFANAKIKTHNFVEGKEILSDLDGCLQTIRSFSHYLSKDFDDKSSFSLFMMYQCKQLEKVLKITIDLYFSENFKLVSPQSKNHLSKILFELIHNSYKHGFAKMISVSIRQVGQEVHCHYKGNGIGFNLLDKKSNLGLGLTLIRKRVVSLNGHIDFKSSPGKGIDVQICFPNHILIQQEA